MTELIHAGWDGFLFVTLMWTGALIALVLLLRSWSRVLRPK